MQRTVRLKLIGETKSLLEPMQHFAEACDFLAREVSSGRCVPAFHALNKAYYRVLRERFGLMAQAAQTAERHVVGTFRTLAANGHADRRPRFRAPLLKLLGTRGRDFSLTLDGTVAISVPGARLPFTYVCADRDMERLMVGAIGGATLVRRKGATYLNVCVTLPDVPLIENPVTPIGVDRGEKILAVARAPHAIPRIADGRRLREARRRHRRIRRRLQRKGTKSAKRVLQNLRGREQRFELDCARVAAKSIVLYAKRFDRPVLVMEDLDGIRERMRARGSEARADRHAWAFLKTAHALQNKAEEAGIEIVYVPAAYTSRSCPKCGDARKSNRGGLAFRCLHCSYRNHADVVGATNIQRLWSSGMLAGLRGRVNGPNGSRDFGAPHQGYKPQVQAADFSRR
ncbi:MAG: RNA-guided endonuclease TnpB family protein [Thermoplasmatota archaeon]